MTMTRLVLGAPSVPSFTSWLSRPSLMTSFDSPISCPSPPSSDHTYKKSSHPLSLVSALSSIGSSLNGISSGLNDLESDLNSLNSTPDSFSSSDQDSFCEDTTMKDPEYYLATGDCFVLADGVLFKIHKFLLVKGSPEFEMMFIEAEYPNGDKTDEDPLVLRVDDSAEAFRRLCWTLYASLNDLWQLIETPVLESPLPRIEKLADIATISHKYGMTATREWAIKGISTIYQKIQNPHSLFRTLDGEDSINVLKHVTLAAEMSYNVFMFERAKKVWTSRIENGDLILQDALAMAEERGWRQFQGRLYLAALRGLAKSSSAPTTSPPPTLREVFDLGRSPQHEAQGPHSTLVISLSLEQRERLFQGHWTLSHIQRKFLDACQSRLPFEDAPPLHKVEEAIWQDFWKACIRHTAHQQQIGLIHNDPLAMLVKLQDLLRDVRMGRKDIGELSRLTNYVALTASDLLEAAEKYVRELKESSLERLPDYFLIP